MPRNSSNDVPKIPLIFLKPPSSIVGPGEAIILPPQSKQVEHEAELVVVIGKRGRNITAEQAGEYVLGYTVGNDVTARDLQNSDDQWTRAKGFDTFCPFGPWIDTEFDVSDAVITSRVNDQPRQMASTRDVVFGVPTLIAFISLGDDARAGGPDLHGYAGGRRPAEGRETKLWWRSKGSACSEIPSGRRTNRTALEAVRPRQACEDLKGCGALELPRRQIIETLERKTRPWTTRSSQ